MVLIYELPAEMGKTHLETFSENAEYFLVSAPENAVICLSANHEILSAKSGTGASVSMPVDGLSCNDTLLVTVTKQNHYRYSGPVVCYAVSMTNESIASGELIFIYSNPVYDNIWIKFSNGFYEKLILQIMDSKGEIV